MKNKTEKDKMLAGELYDAADPELAAERLRARELMRRFNASSDTEMEVRTAMLRDLLGACGPRIGIEPPFYCDYGSYIAVGDNFYMNFGCVVLDCAPVRIGANVQCGPYVQILTAHHPIDPVQRRAGPEL